MRALPLLAAAGLTAACALVLYELRAASAAPPVTVPAAHAQPVAEPPPVAAPPAPVADARPQIRRAVETAAPSLRTQPDVAHYLTELEERARRNHQLTALEVEPGLAAIRRLGGDGDPRRAIEMEAEFMRKMNRLAAELAQNSQ